MRKSLIIKLGLGYSFERDREVLSFVYINYFMAFVFSLVVIMLHVSDEELLPVTYRYHSMVLLGLVNLCLLWKRWITLARILMLSIVPFLLLILPPLAGLFDNEFYFWFPYVPIALSLLPHYILHTKRHRKALIITLSFYLLLGLFSDNLLIVLSQGKESMIPYVIENRFYYKLIPAIIYVFVNIALGLLFSKNYQYQKIMQIQQAELIQAEKMASLGTLTKGIAHEINNPLNFISGGLHALDTLKDAYLKHEGEISAEKKEILQKIDRVMDASLEGVKRTSDIITSLELLASPSEKVKSKVDMNQLFHSVLRDLEHKIPDDISLRKKIALQCSIVCYEAQLKLAITNILENAIDALDNSKKYQRLIDVEVGTEFYDDQESLRISIRNSGPPIPEEDLKQIFDPFFTAKEAGQGKGLGLTISFMIIKNHNGRLEARNEAGMVVMDIILPSNPGD